MMPFLTEETLRNFVAVALVVFLLFLIWDVGIVIKKHIAPVIYESQAIMTAKRSSGYAYALENLPGGKPAIDFTNSNDLLKIIPLRTGAINLDGFTIFGERVSYNYMIAKGQLPGVTTNGHPLASFIKDKINNSSSYTLARAVHDTAALYVIRIYVYGREIWIPVIR